MLVALDTNVLAYAEGINGTARKRAARRLLEKLPPEATLLPIQTLCELFNVLVRKAKRSRASARASVLQWGDAFPSIDTSAAVILSGFDLAVDHELTIWDGLILSAAADAGCRLLLSEDLQEGFTWSGVTVANPFAARRHPLLNALLSESEPGGS
jgi:predicted nucleic acid-binding protein